MDPSTWPSAEPDAARSGREEVVLLDVAVGLSAVAVTGLAHLGRRAVAGLTPVAGVALRPLLSPGHAPRAWLDGIARRGVEERRAIRRAVRELLDALVPTVLVAVLQRVDLTGTVQRYVDLDALVADVDLDAAAARLDIDAVAARLDIDAVAARLDLDAIAARLHVNAVAARLDLDAIAAQLDVDAVARRIDLSAIIDRIDLVGLAEEVINGIDLPEIIRESTGSMASDTVQGVRMQGIAGDEAVSRVVGRLLPRRSSQQP